MWKRFVNGLLKRHLSEVHLSFYMGVAYSRLIHDTLGYSMDGDHLGPSDEVSITVLIT